jgi:hypothetical protein
MRKVCFRLVVLIIVGLATSGASRAQDRHPVTISKDHFPYAFGNFVWWSDADLRAELKKHLPTLGEEIGRGSQIESRVRTVLIQLLREKGIQAEVQAIEPSMDVLSGKRVSIIYSVLSPPEILVEKLTFENAPDDGSGPLNEVAAGMAGKPYRGMTFWSDKQKIREGLQQLGYLSSGGPSE